MSVDFYPRKTSSDGKTDHVWIDGGSRYPFQKGVGSLHGADHAKDHGNDAKSEAWYAEQVAKMKKVSPHLLQDGFDLSYDETLDRAVLQDPVGLDHRLPSEMQEFLDSQAMVNANPTTAAFTTHPAHKLRMQPGRRASAPQVLQPSPIPVNVPRPRGV